MSDTATIERLSHPRDIAAVLRGRRQRAGRLVVLYVRERDGVGDARLTVVASRKVGRAVARNRAKRLLREAARQVTWADGFDIVLVARALCPASRFDEVAEELQRLADELDVVKPNGRHP